MRPDDVNLHLRSAVLELRYGDKTFELSAEFLRVHSPSAEVKGHGPGHEVLQYGKKDVKITRLEAVGHYAIRPYFDDGHDTGIYSWEYLHELCSNKERLWQDYLYKLKQEGRRREKLPADTQAVKIMQP